MAEGILIDLDSPCHPVEVEDYAKKTPLIPSLASPFDYSPNFNNPFDEVAKLVTKSYVSSNNKTETLHSFRSPFGLSQHSNSLLNEGFVGSGSVRLSTCSSISSDDVFNTAAANPKGDFKQTEVMKEECSNSVVLVEKVSETVSNEGDEIRDESEWLWDVPPPAELWEVSLESEDEMGLPALKLSFCRMETSVVESPAPESAALKRYLEKRKLRASLKLPPEPPQEVVSLRRVHSECSLESEPLQDAVLENVPNVALQSEIHKMRAPELRFKKTAVQGQKKGPLKAMVPLKKMTRKGDSPPKPGRDLASIPSRRSNNFLSTPIGKKEGKFSAPVASSTPNVVPAFLRSKSDQELLPPGGTPKRESRYERISSGSRPRSNSAGRGASLRSSISSLGSTPRGRGGKISPVGRMNTKPGSGPVKGCVPRPQSAPSSSPLRTVNDAGARKPLTNTKRAVSQLLPRFRTHGIDMGKENFLQ